MNDTSPRTAVESPDGCDAGLADADSDNLIGVTLHDTYEIGRVVGEGGMGKVYEAQHTRIAAKRFAIKVLRAELAYSPEVRSRFQREADAAASIEHPNVIGVNDFGYAPDGRPYIVYDYLDGMPLSELIEKKQHVEVGIAVYIARQVCRALIAAHEKTVIHRDLKPENIYLLGPSERPEVKVLDFGLSRFMEAPADNNVTRTGVVMGTPSYMAPEQARGERVDHLADIYGAGVLLYVMLTGHAPFEEESPQQTVLAVMSKEATRPRIHAPWIPEELELVIQRAMARAPAERYQSMLELDAALSLFDVLPDPDAVAKSGGMRPQLLSRLGSVTDDVDVGSARSQVVVLLLLSAALVMLGLVTVLSGAPELLRMSRPLSTVEFALIFAAIIGTVLTPVALFVRWLRRRLWNNSVRMVELVPRLRGPLIAAAAVYGLLVLLGRALDGLGTQFSAPVLAPGLSGWMGWGPILFGVALIAALATAIRRRLVESSGGALRRLVAVPAVYGIALVATIALLQLGVRLRSSAAELAALPEPVVPVAVPTASPSTVTPTQPPKPELEPAPPLPAADTAPIERAPTELLAQAIPGGADTLGELRERYPRDPAVLEPLALAYAQRPEGMLPALEALDTLFAVAPNKVLDRLLNELVMKAALAAGGVAARALDLMAQRMGRRGADLLYDMFVTSPSLRVAARERLDNPATKQNFSPALAIAYELKIAKGCEARLPLLARAGKLGDERSLAILQTLSTRTKKGCGPRKLKPCPAPCTAEAAAFKRAAGEIQKRLSAQARPAR
jgi:serine/threonine protein kinase